MMLATSVTITLSGVLTVVIGVLVVVIFLALIDRGGLFRRRNG